jgi:DNA-binding transcriptional regulator YbjK
MLAEALRHVAAQQVERLERLSAEMDEIDTAEGVADRLLDELVTAVRDPGALIAEYELWMEAGRRPELRDTAQSWCATERRGLARALGRLGSSEPETDARLVAAVLDGLGEQVLADDDPVAAAKALRPELRRQVARLTESRTS